MQSIILEIADMVQSQLKPKLIFFWCIQVPNYHSLTDLILAALNQRKRDLSALIKKNLTPHTRKLLEELFVQGGDGKTTKNVES